ncbi:MAG: ATP-binding protein [Thermoplasmata archaeon]|nr:ATP-binding protein [Thermoplasmata archaeon]
MLMDSIQDWNPWWDDPGSIKLLSGRYRDEISDLILTLQDPKVTIISGIRRSGKTTLMYRMIEHLLKEVDPLNILFLGLEDTAFMEVDMAELISEYRKEVDPGGRTYIFLDEVQAKEGWERIVRKENDIHREQKFVVSGSSSRILSGEYATLLTGRNLTTQIHPLSFRNFVSFTQEDGDQINGSRGKEKLDSFMRRYLNVGGFPEVILQPEELRKATLNQYFNDIIHRDIVEQYSVDPRKILSLAGFLMLNIGTTVTLSSLRRSVGLSFDAIKDYLSYLRSAGLFHLLPEFTFSQKPTVKDAGKQKVYSADLGMARYIQGRHSKDYGRFAENAVCLDLLNRGYDPGFLQDKKEIDFVVPGLDGIQLINVCYGETIPEREYAGIDDFIGRYPNLKTYPILVTKSLEGNIDGIEHIPLYQWLYREDDDRP